MNRLNFEMFLSGFMGAGIEFLEIVAIAYALASFRLCARSVSGNSRWIWYYSDSGDWVGSRLNGIPIQPLRCLAGVVLLYFGVTIVFILHGYLMKIPDLFIRLGTGILLVTFGTF
jgi:uncharacterized membrane protein